MSVPHEILSRYMLGQHPLFFTSEYSWQIFYFEVDFRAMKPKQSGSCNFSLSCCGVIICTLPASKPQYISLAEFSFSSVGWRSVVPGLLLISHVALFLSFILFSCQHVFLKTKKGRRCCCPYPGGIIKASDRDRKKRFLFQKIARKIYIMLIFLHVKLHIFFKGV